MSSKPFPARLHALMARDKNIGIVIRRGPAGHVATFRWDVSKDRFQLGQWLKGRIYERRCDISPDGKHFLYFAMNGKWSTESEGAWTSISKVPYLKALDFFPKGDCWEGGGLFLENRTYFLNDRYYREKPHERRGSGLECQTNVRAVNAYGAECLSVYFPRLIRDGWALVEQDNNITAFEKTNRFGLRLRKIAHAGGNKKGQSIYWDEHELINASGDVQQFPSWEWADMQYKSLVFSEKGCLYRVKFSGDSIMKPKLLHDFSPYEFEAIQAPY